MKFCGTWLLLFGGLWQCFAGAQWQLLPDSSPQRVFATDAQSISTIWRNTGDEALAAEVRLRLYQASSATVVLFSEKVWKEIGILPGQTVLETASVDFPPVNAETRFILQWLVGTNRVIGETTVIVFPTNLLAELKSMFGENELAVLDPDSVLKPWFYQNGVRYLDLADRTLDNFSGRLAVIGPFRSREEIRPGLSQAIKRIAEKGVAVVWLQPAPGPQDAEPSFYVVNCGKGVVVIAQSSMVADFSRNPVSQQNLIHFCKLALNPMPWPLPNFLPPP